MYGQVSDAGSDNFPVGASISQATLISKILISVRFLYMIPGAEVHSFNERQPIVQIFFFQGGGGGVQTRNLYSFGRIGGREYIPKLNGNCQIPFFFFFF